MRLLEIKNIIREEVAQAKVNLLESDINKLNNNFRLNESILASIIDLFIGGKLKRKAEMLKNSPEYIELLQQAKVSTEALNAITKQLKTKVDEYETLVTGLQKDGVPVKMGMDISQMQKLIKKQHASLYTKYNLDKKRF